MARPQDTNPSEKALYYREWRKTDAGKKYLQKEKEKIKGDKEERQRRTNYMKKWVSIPDNRAKKNETMRISYTRNIEKRRESVKNSYRKLRLEALVRYSTNPPECACCKDKNIIFLTIDHIAGDGAEHRRKIGLCGVTNPKGKVTNFPNWLKKNNYPEGFQVLCFNCNWAKSHGGCPHKN